MAEQDKQPPCEVCRLIRNYLLLAVPIILIIYTQPQITGFKGIDLTRTAAALFALLLVVVVAWKAYHEFWKPKSDDAKNNRP